MKYIVTIMLLTLPLTADDIDDYYAKYQKAFAEAIDKSDRKMEQQIKDAKEAREAEVKATIKKYLVKLNKVKSAYTKADKLDKALEVRNKIEELEKLLVSGKTPEIKNTPKDDGKLTLADMEKTLGYKFSFVTRMREHKDAVKCEATGHYYKYFATGRTITWDAAQKKCKEMGGHLATVTSDEELKTVLQASKLKWGHAAFIGMKDEKQSGDWKWVTGEPADFLPWWGTEPSRTPGEIHGCIYKNQFGDVPTGWSGLVGFICEWPK